MNIAVFLPGWIGDAVMATPALRALRNHFRDACLLGVLKPYVAGVLEGGDWFDEWIPAFGGPPRRAGAGRADPAPGAGADQGVRPAGRPARDHRQRAAPLRRRLRPPGR